MSGNSADSLTTGLLPNSQMATGSSAHRCDAYSSTLKPWPLNGSGLLRSFAATLCCLTLVCGCGAKTETQGANEPRAAKEAQTSTDAHAPKEPRIAEAQESASVQNWPRQLTNGGNRLTYYQPQIDSWTDYRQLDGRVAVVLTPVGSESVTGMITFQAQTDTDLEERTVVIHDIRIDKCPLSLARRGDAAENAFNTRGPAAARSGADLPRSDACRGGRRGTFGQQLGSQIGRTQDLREHRSPRSCCSWTANPVKAPIPQAAVADHRQCQLGSFLRHGRHDASTCRRRRCGCRLPRLMVLGPSPRLCRRIWRNCPMNGAK